MGVAKVLRGLRPDPHAYFRAQAAEVASSSGPDADPTPAAGLTSGSGVPSLLQARRHPTPLCAPAPDALGLSLADLALDASAAAGEVGLLRRQPARTLAFRVASARGLGTGAGGSRDAALSARFCLMGGDGALRGGSVALAAQRGGLLGGGAGSWAFPSGEILVLRVPFGEAGEEGAEALGSARPLRLYVELNSEAPLAPGEAARLPASARLRTRQVTETTAAWCRVPLKYLFEARPGDRVTAKLVAGPTPLASQGGVLAASAKVQERQRGKATGAASSLLSFARRTPAPGGSGQAEAGGAGGSAGGQLELEVLELAQAVRWDTDLLPAEVLAGEALGTAVAAFRELVARRVLRDKGSYSTPVSSVALRTFPRVLGDDDCRALFLADWGAAIAQNGGRAEGLGALFEASCAGYWPVFHAPGLPEPGLPNDRDLRQRRQAAIRKLLEAGPAVVFEGRAGSAQAPFDASETRYCLADRAGLLAAAF